MMDNETLNKAIKEISRNHRKIIDDWCKAYLAQLYEEGTDIKPGCFILYESHEFENIDGKLYKKYWFKKSKEE